MVELAPSLINDFSQTRMEKMTYDNADNVMDREMLRAENISGLTAGTIGGVVGSATAIE